MRNTTSPPKNRGSSPPRSTSPVHRNNRLQITVLEAKGLSPKDKHAMPDVQLGSKLTLQHVANAINSDDPFCKVRLGKQTQKTATKTGTLNPRWNETMVFENFDPVDELQVVIRDNVALQSAIFKGHFFGEVVVPISKLPKGSEVEQWFPLTKRKNSHTDVTGQLLLRILYQSKEDVLEGSEKQGDRVVPLDPTPSEPTSEHPEGFSLSKTVELPTTKSSLTNSDSSNPGSATIPGTKQRSMSASRARSANSSGEYSYLSGSVQNKPSITFSNGQVEYRDPITQKLNEAAIVQKNQNFAKKFGLPTDEVLMKDFSCALQRNILMQGRMYISHNYVCFYSNLFGVKTQEVIAIKDIVDIIKLKSMGINIKTSDEVSHNFVSFFSKDKAFDVLNKVWNKKGTASNDSASETKDTASHDEEILEEEEDEGEDAFLTTEDVDGGFLNYESYEMKEVVNDTIPVSLMKFFKFFFAGAAFTKTYHEFRGDFDIVVKEWENQPQLGTTRQVHYSAPLNFAIGPSKARCEETQRYQLTKTKLTVETITYMYDIPYGDTFRIEGRWEVTPVGLSSSKIVISVGVHFMKKTIFKGKIESNSIKENKESFEKWVSLAKREIMTQSTITSSVSSLQVSKSASKDEMLQESPRDLPSPRARRSSLTGIETVLPAKKSSMLSNLTGLIKMPAIPSFEIITSNPVRTSLFGGNFLMMLVLYLFGILGFVLVSMLTLVVYFSFRVVELEQRVAELENLVKKKS